VLTLFALAALADTPQTVPAENVERLVRQGMGLRLVHVWATWCGPCVKDFDRLDDLTEAWHGQGLSVVALSVDRDEDALERFLEDKRTTWQHYRVREGGRALGKELAELGASYKGAVPYNLLLSAEGEVLESWGGALPMSKLKQRVEPHLTGPASSGPTPAQLAAVEMGTVTIVHAGRAGDAVFIDNWNAGVLPLTTDIISGTHDFRVEGDAGTIEAAGVLVAFDGGAVTVDLATRPSDADQ